MVNHAMMRLCLAPDHLCWLHEHAHARLCYSVLRRIKPLHIELSARCVDPWHKPDTQCSIQLDTWCPHDCTRHPAQLGTQRPCGSAPCALVNCYSQEAGADPGIKGGGGESSRIFYDLSFYRTISADVWQIMMSVLVHGSVFVFC